jgi:choline dehydrogenase-like flavoprotein
VNSLLNDPRRSALRALCDTVVPRVERSPDPSGFWGRSATDLGVDHGIEELVAGIPDETARGGLLEVLDALVGHGLAEERDQRARELMLHGVSRSSPEAAGAVQALAGMALFLTYGLADPTTGRNPNWEILGYPGPLSPPPDVPKELEPLVPSAGEVLEADVCVVGSGAGGGVIAGTLARHGLSVVVLEAGGHYNESDFTQLELKAYQEMYWRGGPTPTADGHITLQAGAVLGGGTTVNWTNCLRTTPWVREEWARDFGLEGVDGPDYDRHLDTVMERIGATDACSELNRPQQRLEEACDRLGWEFRLVVRNTEQACHAPGSAAYMGFGDQSGAKNTVVKTFLRDAVGRGARVAVRCRADRVLVEHGRAAGVQATFTDGDGRPVPVTVRAPRVVVAGGALESPALLLRSGIGGPAVGTHLRVHPCTAVLGIYGEDQEAWWGAPQAGLCHQWEDTGGGFGFLIETTQYAPALIGSALPWTGGVEHKELIARARYGATFIALTRDRGHGRVVVDGGGEAVPLYEVGDEVDLRNLRQGLDAQARLHEAAGAREILALAAGLPRWAAGEDLDAFIAAAQRVPMGAGGHRLFSAHQMGTCRMGLDPQTSVAGPWGELHDVSGVWIGDGSAFPTASGTNPMVSIMALAHRTAEAIAGVADRGRDRAATGGA